MQARSAYISSLSTTTIMVAGALLMLALLGATVGFRHWPHGDGGSPIDSIGMSSEPSHVLRAAKVVPPPKPPARPARASAPARPASAPGSATAGPTATAGAPTSPAPVTGVIEVPPAPPAAPEPSSQSGPSTAPRSQPMPDTPPPTRPSPDPVRHLLEPAITPVTEAVGPVPVSLPQAQ
jgi:hypothetical protein